MIFHQLSKSVCVIKMCVIIECALLICYFQEGDKKYMLTLEGVKLRDVEKMLSRRPMFALFSSEHRYQSMLYIHFW